MDFIPVPEHPEYLVSSCGEIWSTKTNKLFSKRTNNTGYYQTCFYIDGHNKYLLISRVVASAYLSMDLYDETVEVDHIDDDKSNNHYTNLQVLAKKNHNIKTRESRGHKEPKYCKVCSCKINNRSNSYEAGICRSCRTSETDLSEEQIEERVKNLGSWVEAAKTVGLSDNGLRKMYIRVSGGKDPKLLKKKIKSQK